MAHPRLEDAFDVLAGVPLLLPAGAHMDAFQERARTLLYLALIGRACEIDDPAFAPELERMQAVSENIPNNERVAIICKGLIEMIAAGHANDLMEYVRGFKAND